MLEDVLMIHGAFCRSRSLETLAGAFAADGWRSRVPDLPLHGPDAVGRDPHPELGRLSLLDYLAFLEREIDDMGQPPVLVGHSMGALLTLMLAARGRARAAILVTPATPWGFPPLTWRQWKTHLSLATSGQFWRRGLRPSFELAREGSFNRLPDAAVPGVVADLVPESGRVLFEMLFWHLDSRRASYVNLDAIDCPVLVVGAGEDRVTPALSSWQLASRLSRVAHYVQFDENAHWIIEEPGWDRLVDCCLDWLDGTQLRPNGRAA